MKIAVLFAVFLVTLAECQKSNGPPNYRVEGAVIPGGLYMPMVNQLEYCKENSTCWGKANVMRKVNNVQEKVCCGWVEYEKNGAPMQTSTKCLFVEEFEKYWEEANKLRNMESIAVGCKVEGIEGPELSEYAYGGPE